MSTVQVKNAIVKDTAVSVKNVFIGKRQLTQRVFRQIQSENIINLYTGELKGEAWGFVNYFWKGDGNESDLDHGSKHLLWINENRELRRWILHNRNIKYNAFQSYINHNPIYYIKTSKREEDPQDIFIDIQMSDKIYEFVKVKHCMKGQEISYEDFQTKNPNYSFKLENGHHELRDVISNHNLWGPPSGKKRYSVELEWMLKMECYNEIKNNHESIDLNYLEGIYKHYPEAKAFSKKTIFTIRKCIDLALSDYNETTMQEIIDLKMDLYFDSEQLYIAC